MEEEITLRDAKRNTMIEQAIELITTAPGLTNEQIANRLEISIPTLYTLIKGEYAQELLRKELYQRKQIVDQWIQELYDTTPRNPANQRFALKIQADITRALADKIYPTKTQNTNLNINIDLTEQNTHSRE